MKALSAIYAQALHNTSLTSQSLTLCFEQLTQSQELLRLLTHPLTTPVERNASLQALLPESSSQELQFLNLLCNNGHLNELKTIISRLRQIELETTGEAEGLFFCARPPRSEDLRRLESQLARRSGRQRVTLNVCIDESLLGGFKIEFDGVICDGSVATALSHLNNHLLAR